jgi:hypothetical protein
VATKLTQPPWFSKPNWDHPPFLHWSFEVGNGCASTTTMSPVQTPSNTGRGKGSGEQSEGDRLVGLAEIKSGPERPALSVTSKVSSPADVAGMLKVATLPRTDRLASEYTDEDRAAKSRLGADRRRPERTGNGVDRSEEYGCWDTRMTERRKAERARRAELAAADERSTAELDDGV